jgi:cysteine desulfurase
MNERLIYLDHAATTPCSRESWTAMSDYFLEHYGNPNSIHTAGRRARAGIEDARARIAALLGARPAELAITGGGTEANNTAIHGAAVANADRGRHVVTSTIEHVSTLRACERLEEEGFSASYVKADRFGLLDPHDVAAAVRPDTVLVTIAHANNEMGTIQPIQAIAAAIKAVNPRTLIHCDAVQTTGHLPIDVDELGVDLLTLTAHKFYGPKGIAALYVRDGVRISPLFVGGGDERRLRIGTESVPLVVGMAVALEQSVAAIEQREREWQPLRDRFIRALTARLDGVLLNGHPTQRLSTNVNVSLPGINGEDLVLLLAREGICASTGSACATGSLEPSHVLLAIGRDREEALSALRISFGDACKGIDVDWLAGVIARIVTRRRSIAPRRTFAYAFTRPEDQPERKTA